MAISNKNKQVLIDLFSSPRGLYAYTLYGRYGLTPSEALLFMEEYKNKGVIQVDLENRICMTKEGRKQIMALINNANHTINQAESFLEQFRSAKSIDINEPYLPDEIFYYKYVAREADKTRQ